MKIDLSGRTALVCGASKGIGAAISQQFADCGAKVILVARNKDELLKKQLELSGVGHEIVTADLSRQDEVANLCQLITSYQIDIVVNNSGGPAPGLISESKVSSFQDAINSHLYAGHNIMQAVLPGMKQRSFGRFLNVISTSVRIPISGLGVSNTVRGAMASWAKTLSNEVAQFGITVNNILPGLTETDRLFQIITNSAVQSNLSEDEVTLALKSTIPAGRFGMPTEMGFLAAFLASEFGGYITGVSIPVDGGKTGSV